MIVTILVPEIKHLPRCTALCLRNFYYKDLGLLAPERYPEPPRAGELYDDLERLCSYEGVRNAILVFHALEIVQKRIHGKQTLRAYPFPDHTFHGTNRRDIIMFCPPHEEPDKFDISESSDEILYGELIFLFKMYVRFDAGIKLLELAFVKQFAPCPPRRDDLLAKAG